jgi:hypothetical protein
MTAELLDHATVLGSGCSFPVALASDETMGIIAQSKHRNVFMVVPFLIEIEDV